MEKEKNFSSDPEQQKRDAAAIEALIKSTQLPDPMEADTAEEVERRAAEKEKYEAAIEDAMGAPPQRGKSGEEVRRERSSERAKEYFDTIHQQGAESAQEPRPVEVEAGQDSIEKWIELAEKQVNLFGREAHKEVVSIYKELRRRGCNTLTQAEEYVSSVGKPDTDFLIELCQAGDDDFGVQPDLVHLASKRLQELADDPLV